MVQELGLTSTSVAGGNTEYSLSSLKLVDDVETKDLRAVPIGRRLGWIEEWDSKWWPAIAGLDFLKGYLITFDWRQKVVVLQPVSK